MARDEVQLTDAEILTVQQLEELENNSLIYKDNSGVYQRIAFGTSGQVLQSNGATTAPSFENNGNGDVTGPSSSTDNAIARFDGTTGKTIQNSGASIDDSGNLTATNFSGSSNGTNTGDQTSIVGITGTIAQFNTSCTDSDFVDTTTSNQAVAQKNFTRVGIGVNPTNYLDILNASASGIYATIKRGAGGFTISLDASNNDIISNTKIFRIGTSDNLPLDFYTNSATRGRVSGAGNFIFGNTTDDTVNKVQITGDIISTGAFKGKLNLPEGTLVNGVITPSITSSNLTVAIKTLAGTDPSATDPIYVVIDGVVRSITSPTNVTITRNAATNYLNAGSTELATKDVQFFVYLGWDTTTSSVGILIARIPYGKTNADFVGSQTDEKGRLRSLSFISTDKVVNIGRFTAILSAGAGYTWSTPAGGFNVVNRPIYETDWLDIVPTLTWTGTSPSYGTTSYKYKIIGSLCHIKYIGYNTGTGGLNTQVQATLPFSPSNVSLGYGNVASGTTPNAACVDFSYSNSGKLTANFLTITADLMLLGGFYQI